MSSFIHKMISRHIAPSNNVRPRLRGRFEEVEAASGRITANGNAGITEEVIENTGINTNYDVSEGKNNQNIAKESLQNLPDFTNKNYSEKGTEKNHQEYRKNSIEKPFSEESGDHKISKESVLIPPPSPTQSHQVFPEKKKRMFPDESQKMLLNPIADLPNENKLLKNLQVDKQLSSAMSDSNIRKNSNEANSTLEQEMENVLSQLAMLNKEKTETESSNINHNNSLMGPHMNGKMPNVKQSFEPVFTPPEQPVIKVSIGRINIRAEIQKTAPTMRPKQPAAKPKMSLEDYLKKQNHTSR